MAATVPTPSPDEDTLRRRIDMCKRILEFFIKITSGVVYSIVMHCVIITAYAFLIFQTGYTTGFDSDMLAPIFFFYLPYTLLEIGVRWFEQYAAHPLLVPKSGHLAHLFGVMMLPVYMGTPVEGFIWTLLMLWCAFVLYGCMAILYAIQHFDGSLTQPLLV